jgi:hypothetical protein
MEDEDREEKAGYFTVVVLSLEIQESARVRGKLSRLSFHFNLNLD